MIPLYLQTDETRPAWTTIFIGPFGLRAGWRWLLFLLLFIGFATGLSFAARGLAPLVTGDPSFTDRRLRISAFGFSCYLDHVQDRWETVLELRAGSSESHAQSACRNSGGSAFA